MGLFRRGGRNAPQDTPSVEATDESDEGTSTPPDGATPSEDAPVAQDGADGPAASARPTGPWDVTEVTDTLARLDLGAIRVPGVPGMEIRLDKDKSSDAIAMVTLSVDGSVLQVQAFAAPRTDGIWDEIREEISESVTKQGGSVDDVPGPYGRELLARLPVRTPEGRTGHRPARFLGWDGPRWFLRGVLTGKAAVDPAAARVLEAVFGQIVVVRGDDARAPRDLLVLTRPDVPAAPKIAPESSAPAAPDFDPLTRGPEITEIR